MEPLLPLDEDHQSYSGWVGGLSTDLPNLAEDRVPVRRAR